MKLKNRLCIVLAVLILCLSLFACSGKTPEQDAASENESQDSAQNSPVRAITGVYSESSGGRGSVEITQKENDGAYIVVRWINSPTESVTWNMSGVLNERKKTIEYEDALKTVSKLDGDGNPVIEVGYRNGTGVFTFDDEGMKWSDLEEHFADGLLFVRT